MKVLTQDRSLITDIRKSTISVREQNGKWSVINHVSHRFGNMSSYFDSPLGEYGSEKRAKQVMELLADCDKECFTMPIS